MDQDGHLRTTESDGTEEPGPAAAADRGEVERLPGELGFSLNELLIVVAIIGILAVVVICETFNAIEKARLAACMANMVAVRESVWANCDGGMDFPERAKLWDEIWRGSGPRGYWYALDNDDANKGHGNDLDGFDEQNPGNAPRTDRNIYFVLACTHDHGRLADYVFLEDEGPPQIAQGNVKPTWHKFYRKETGRDFGGGNNGGGEPGNGGGNNGSGNNGGGNNGGGNNGGGNNGGGNGRP